MMARGGRSLPDAAVIVGERRPEIFVPDRPGRVIANNKLKFGGAGGASQGGGNAVPSEGGQSGEIERTRLRETVASIVREVFSADLARRGPILRSLEQSFELRRTGIYR